MASGHVWIFKHYSWTRRWLQFHTIKEWMSCRTRGANGLLQEVLHIVLWMTIYNPLLFMFLKEYLILLFVLSRDQQFIWRTSPTSTSQMYKNSTPYFPAQTSKHFQIKIDLFLWSKTTEDSEKCVIHWFFFGPHWQMFVLVLRRNSFHFFFFFINFSLARLFLQ